VNAEGNVHDPVHALTQGRTKAGLESREASRLPPNGEVEGPPRSANQVPRAHSFLQRPRRTTAGTSRPPPTIVRPRQMRTWQNSHLLRHERRSN
jgi:hypothetical protein